MTQFRVSSHTLAVETRVYINMIMFLGIYVVVIEPYFRNFFCKWPMTYDLPYCQNKSRSLKSFIKIK